MILGRTKGRKSGVAGKRDYCYWGCQYHRACQGHDFYFSVRWQGSRMEAQQQGVGRESLCRYGQKR